MSMTIKCDICNRLISDGKMSAGMRNEFLSTTLTVGNPVFADMPDKTLTICPKCHDDLWYLLENADVLRNRVSVMKLGNRLRYLFKLPLKMEVSKGAGKCE